MRVAVIGCGSMGLLAHLPARNFARAVEGLDEPIAPGEQGCLALEAVVGAYASAARRSLVTIAVRDGPTFVCATTADHLASDVVEILPEQLAQLYRDLGCDPSSPNSPGD